MDNNQQKHANMYNWSVQSSPQEGITNSMFIDTITEYLTHVLAKHKNNVILGDFNIHTEDLSSSNTVIFNDTMEALGLEQHVKFPTHRCGSTLDLISTEVWFGPTPAAPHRGPLLSDHHLVSLQLHHKKEIPSRKEVSVRKINKLTTESLSMEFKPGSVCETNDLPTLISQLDGKLKHTLDTLAPEKKCSVTTHVKQPWFDHFVRERHTIVRNREQVWLTYQTQDAWTAYKKECNIYNRFLKFRKKQVISGMVIDAGRDTKKLYKIINNITGTKEDNLMPPGDSDMEIAQGFVEYFVEKIYKIRDKFECVPPYSPPVKDVPRLRKFAPLTETETRRPVSSLQNKSCDIDPVPAKVFQLLQDKLIPIYMRIINLSLGKVSLHKTGKTPQ